MHRITDLLWPCLMVTKQSGFDKIRQSQFFKVLWYLGIVSNRKFALHVISMSIAIEAIQSVIDVMVV